MILTKYDLKQYLSADRKALGRTGQFGLREWLFAPIWKFERLLRKREYIYNRYPSTCGLLGRVRRIWNAFWYHRLEIKLGFTIPPNCFGPGLCITHLGTIVVNPSARIGKNCIVNVDVNIGSHGSPTACPQIGDNCFIGPGAKLFGPITIGNDVKIGANAVVNKSFGSNCVLVGVPAHEVKREGV